jgi:hypothetical protein
MSADTFTGILFGLGILLTLGAGVLAQYLLVANKRDK